MSIPVFTSQARQGFGPQLTLSYQSGVGNGPFGLGWTLAVPSITRKTSLGLPRYRDDVDSDVFILAGSTDLVPLLDDVDSEQGCDESIRVVEGRRYLVRRYRPRVESAFARIERWHDTEHEDVHWRTISKENVTSLYGQDAASRVADPAEPTHVFTWLLDLSFDDRGNAVRYIYKAEDRARVPNTASEVNRIVGANRYLKRVLYGNDTPYLPGVERFAEQPDQWCFELVLDYGEHDLDVPTPVEDTTWSCRCDPFSSYRSSFEVRTYRTCRRLLMFHRLAELGEDPVVVRSTDLRYQITDAGDDSTLPRLSLMASATQTGWVPRAGGGYATKRLPPLEFGYSPLAIDQTQHTADDESLQNLVGACDETRERWVDLDGEGLPGLLTDRDDAWYYKHNVSAWNPDGGPARARFEPLALLDTKPASGSLMLTDLNGDGNLCAVSLAPPDPGWFERHGDTGWTPRREFATTANVDWSSPNLRFADLNGDGLADVLITEDDAFTWYPWEVSEGFGEPRRVAPPDEEDRGPALVFADPEGSIFLADMSGDGLCDLVRIRNGEVCYWPNLGYGRFGAKITMDRAPAFDFPDRFDERRIRLADIDGSGTADLVYLGERAMIWFNESGNAWTAATEVAEFPQVNLDTQTSVFDLLGTGTACLTWTSPLPGDAQLPFRYIDLTGGVKPHLLTTVSNNLGATRTLCYAPSTKFYVEDRDAGNPWITRLPFPVHVVERVETTDAITRTSYVATYSYHHGLYDGVEREFRGFARVDKLDADALPAASGIGDFTSTPEMTDGSFDLPPVLTRTWYHTGALLDAREIAARLAQEYWTDDPDQPRLAQTILPNDVTAEELREACRALNGHVLREETYALDGTFASVNPYVTTEHRYEVDLLQPPTSTAYGVFYTWQRESITCHYERDRTDPRVTHDLSLTRDPYGNLTRRASVAYPRRVPAYLEQAATLISYHQNEFANVPGRPDWYRLGLPVETRSYELTGVEPSRPDGLFDPVVLDQDAEAAAEIPYEAKADRATPQRRALGRQRTIYRRDDLSSPLPIGQVESLAIVDSTYVAHLTPGLLSESFEVKLSAGALAELLKGPGAFVDLDGDGTQWSPSSRLLYSADPARPDPGRAREHFYLPVGAIDPWENVATVAYDDHDLLVVGRLDAAQNAMSAVNNYRVLGPWLVTDPNLNRRGVRYDALGMIVATAAMGKLEPDGSDEGDHLDISTPEPSAGDDPTTRLKYDLFAYGRWAADAARDPDHPAPTSVHTLARVRHKDPTTPWIESYDYSDGLGRVALRKTQAEPGRAPERDATGKLVRDLQGAIVFAWADHRWVGTGRVVYDNKGNPVKSYEPFFDSGPIYDDETDLVRWGVTSITRYDPLSRPTRVDNPDGTYRTIELTPWHTVTVDENDAVLTSAWYACRSGGQLGADQADAAAKAAAHANTPGNAALDTLGRVFRTTVDNGDAGRYTTALTLDIEGRVLSTTDALGRAVLTQVYDMSGAEIFRSSVDAGARWLLADAGGQLLQAWDSREFTVVGSYDELRRPTALAVTDAAGERRVAERIEYGEGLADGQALNLRGAAHRQFDETGVATTSRRDFDGNVLSATRQLLVDAVHDVDWSTDPRVNAETFATSRTYDALNRVVTVTTPDESVTTMMYNARSLLAAVTVKVRGGTTAAIVDSISYDARGERQSMVYANGARTAYTYDPESLRLTELRTTRPGGRGPLQDLRYAYDAVGNITRVTDRAQQTIFFDNQVVNPSADYTYDAIYRLTRSRGREHVSRGGPATTGGDDSARCPAPLPSDGQAMGNYTELCAYDPVGNLQSVTHSAASGGWKRLYGYDARTTSPAGNHMTSTTVGGTTGQYTYDAHGNITSMPHLSQMQWDWKDQLQVTANQIVKDGDPETTRYRYDSSGQRTLKTCHGRNGARTAERIYLGACEIYREYDPAGEVKLERQSLHVMDQARRICVLETTTVDMAPTAGPRTTTASPTTLTRYQFGNHLGSAVLELDDSAAIITYEEYYPYGGTSLQSGRSVAEVGLKRYRFTGKERDRETGFYYHGSRYYAPTLGRWTSADSVATAGGTNLYEYCGGNPVAFSDPTGTDRSIADINRAFDTHSGILLSGDKVITFPELMAGLDCTTISVSDWAAMMRVDTGGYQVDANVAALLLALESSADAEVADRPIVPDRTLDTPVMGEEGGQVYGYIPREALAEQDRSRRAVRDGTNLINTVKLAGAVLTPEYYFPAQSIVHSATGHPGLAALDLLGVAGGRVAGELGGGATADLAPANVERGLSMNSSSTLQGVERASDDLIASVAKRRTVQIAAPGSEELRYLDYMGAEANVGGENMTHILLRPNPSKAALLEEFLHGTQHKLGIIEELGASGLGSAETHVKDFMIRYARFLGLSPEDVAILKQLRDAGL